MSQRWLAPALLGLAAVGALLIAIWSAGMGANWLVWVPVVALIGALALWFHPRRAWAAFAAAGATLIVAFLGGFSIGMFLLPSVLLAGVAGALELAAPRTGPTGR